MSEQYQGRIQLIVGPMFAGKSSELLRRVRRFQHAAKKCIVINIKDQRYAGDSFMATHDKMVHQAIKTDNLQKQMLKMMNADVVAIDEAQFFPDIVEVCQKLADFGKIVIVAALDATFERKSFGNISNLIPISQTIDKLSAICIFCNKQASFTLRTIDCNQVQYIGGQEFYKPVCRSCHAKNKK